MQVVLLFYYLSGQSQEWLWEININLIFFNLSFILEYANPQSNIKNCSIIMQLAFELLDNIS